MRHAKDGIVDFEILFPKVLNVTACCFGGKHHDSDRPKSKLKYIPKDPMTISFMSLQHIVASLVATLLCKRIIPIQETFSW